MALGSGVFVNAFFCLSLVGTVACFSLAPSFAQGDSADFLNEGYADPSIGAPTQDNDQILNTTFSKTAGNLLSAQLAIRSGDPDKAVAAAKKAVKYDPNDIDNHKSLAEAYELKIATQEEPDQEMIRDCLSEWLCVMRADVGEEKGLSALGPGIAARLYGDSERYGAARDRIKAITGSLPRMWETTDMFLKRVVKPEVHAKIINLNTSAKIK